jgi:hypothetical protein
VSESYVTAGARLRCSCGQAESVLQVPVDHKSLINNKPEGNIMDFQPGTNVQSFGLCSCRQNPSVTKATAANHNRLKPMPCVPATVNPWQNGKNDFLVENYPALLTSSCLRCKWGGVISIVDCGQ